MPGNDDRPRITWGGECAVFVAVGVNGNLHRRAPDANVVVLANERLYTGCASDGGSSGLAVFNDDKALLAVSIELLRLAYFVFIDDALNF